MPTITVPDETYERLSRQAARLGTTVDAVALPALEQVGDVEAVQTGPPAVASVKPPFAEWKKRYDEWQAVVAARADRYPADHVLDVSRETIYEGCGE